MPSFTASKYKGGRVWSQVMTNRVESTRFADFSAFAHCTHRVVSRVDTCWNESWRLGGVVNNFLVPTFISFTSGKHFNCGFPLPVRFATRFPAESSRFCLLTTRVDVGVLDMSEIWLLNLFSNWVAFWRLKCLCKWRAFLNSKGHSLLETCVNFRGNRSIFSRSQLRQIIELRNTDNHDILQWSS